MEKIKYCIRENSLLARIAAWQLGVGRVAVVWRSSIHLYNTGRNEFLNNAPWVRHELCHLEQFRRYGWLRFAGLYFWESLTRGYHKNRFEAEARLAEKEEQLPAGHVYEEC